MERRGIRTGAWAVRGVVYKRQRLFCFFFQAEDGIRDLVRSRGLGDVYKRQERVTLPTPIAHAKGIFASGIQA